MRALGVVRPNPADPQCLNQHGAINDYCARQGWDIVDVLYDSADGHGVVKQAIDRVEQRDADVLMAAVTGTLWETDHEARAFLARRQRKVWALVITEIGLDTTTSFGAATASALLEPLAVPPCSQPLPRTDLVKRVSGTTDLVAFDSSAYLDVDLLEAALGEPLRERARILDFGCGCGRLLRRLVDRAPESHFTGCDIDAEAITWVRDALGVDASVTEAFPPLPYDDGAFDLVIGFSVFTHLDEVHQDAWLPELHRVPAPGGAALLSLHGPAAWETAALTSLAGRPALVGLAREREERGIVHWLDDGWESMFPDWYHTTFHTPGYVREHWRKWFTTVDVVPGTVLRNHDIAVACR